MRDPERIPKILSELRALWETYPDLRLNQLISNINSPHKIPTDPFHIEDEDFTERMKEYGERFS
jgi:hypothetical protein